VAPPTLADVFIEITGDPLAPASADGDQALASSALHEVAP